MDFDYKTAWDKNRPLFDEISHILQPELDEIAKDETIVQVKHPPRYDKPGTVNGEIFTMGMPVKELDVTVSRRLLTLMALHDTHILSRMAIITWRNGHWSYGEHYKKATEAGAYWKLSLAFTQCVRERLIRFLPDAFVPKSYRPYLGVHDGELRMHYSTPNCWRNIDLGVADLANASMAYALIQRDNGEPTEKMIRRIRRYMFNFNIEIS